MMMFEFEGRTEKEAIDKAADELGLERDSFDVEILETQKSGLFKKGYVKIRVIMENTPKKNPATSQPRQEKRKEPSPAPVGFENEIIDFLDGLIKNMDFEGQTEIQFREASKIGLRIDSPDSSFLIGRKGKTLDSLQLLVNNFAGKLGHYDIRFILDCENYRVRREESLVRLAYSTAERVREKHTSILLEPMNPFDRRLIHTTLNDIGDIDTKSEGEGMYKQVRVIYKGAR